MIVDFRGIPTIERLCTVSVRCYDILLQTTQNQTSGVTGGKTWYDFETIARSRYCIGADGYFYGKTIFDPSMAKSGPVPIMLHLDT